MPIPIAWIPHPCGPIPAGPTLGLATAHLTSPFGCFTNRVQGSWRELCDMDAVRPTHIWDVAARNQ